MQPNPCAGSASRPPRRKTGVTAAALVLLVAGAASGCGSSSARGVPDPGGYRINNTTISGLSSTVTIRTIEDIHVSADTLPYAADRLWPHLVPVYRELGVAPRQVDEGARVVSNPGLHEQGRLGSVRLSRYFRCGRSLTGDNADQYALRVEAVTQLVPSETGGTAVLTYVGASARPSGLSTGAVRCASTGSLEDRIVAGLVTRLVQQEGGTGGG